MYRPFLMEFLLVLSGGCQGNGNRFASREFCEAACGRRGGRRRRPQLGPLGSLPGVDICNLPVDRGDRLGCREVLIIQLFLHYSYFFLRVHIVGRSVRRQAEQVVLRRPLRRVHGLLLLRLRGQRQPLREPGAVRPAVRGFQGTGKLIKIRGHAEGTLIKQKQRKKQLH